MVGGLGHSKRSGGGIGRKGKMQIIKNEKMSSALINFGITFIYAIFVVYSIIQTVTMVDFFNNFSVAFELISEFNTATSYSAVLQNTGFTLWRHYNGLA